MGVVCAAAVGNYAQIPRQTLALNNESLGLLFSLFYVAYTAAQFSIGGLMDRAEETWRRCHWLGL